MKTGQGGILLIYGVGPVDIPPPGPVASPPPGPVERPPRGPVDNPPPGPVDNPPPGPVDNPPPGPVDNPPPGPVDMPPPGPVDAPPPGPVDMPPPGPVDSPPPGPVLWFLGQVFRVIAVPPVLNMIVRPTYTSTELFCIKCPFASYTEVVRIGSHKLHEPEMFCIMSPWGTKDGIANPPGTYGIRP